MKRIVFHVFVLFVAFGIGVIGTYRIAEKTNLEKITADIDHYDGRRVEIETYAQLDSFENEWFVGEQFEKREAFTYLNVSDDSPSINTLREQLRENLTENEYNRIKVRVVGTLHDNCNKGVTCCFGPILKLSDAQITPINSIERYVRPLPQ